MFLNSRKPCIVTQVIGLFFLGVWRERLKNGVNLTPFTWHQVINFILKQYFCVFFLLRVLEAGKATIYTTLSAPKTITHVLTNNMALKQETGISEAPCYPVSYLGTHLLEVSIAKILSFLPDML